jgi:hypothetical protein
MNGGLSGVYISLGYVQLGACAIVNHNVFEFLMVDLFAGAGRVAVGFKGVVRFMSHDFCGRCDYLCGATTPDRNR